MSDKGILQKISEKVEGEVPITVSDAAFLYERAEDTDLKRLATLVRNRYHPADEATYLIMAIINFTNVCVAKCDFCAFYRLPHQAGTYLLSFEQICQRLDRLQELGGTLVSFNGGFHPKLTLSDYEELFSRVHALYPNLTFFEMTIAEFMFFCKKEHLSYAAGAERMKAAGTRWITGGGAEILDDRFRSRHCPGKYTVSDYFKAQRAVLDAGMRSTATMVIGFDETLDERLSHLNTLREFQDAVDRRLTSFLCWTYKPYNNELGGAEISTSAYLRWLGVCRIFLHNFIHVRTSVLTQNDGALRGLRFGANDFDLPIEDEVTEKAGATISLDFSAILEAAHNEGFRTRRRLPF